jgi:hypothetical protein
MYFALKPKAAQEAQSTGKTVRELLNGQEIFH